MVIQNYDVKTSSQRNFLSVSSNSWLASRNLNAARAGMQNTPQISQSQGQQDTVQLSNGKTKKPNNGNSYGHFKQMYEGIKSDSLKHLSSKTSGRRKARGAQVQQPDGKYGGKKPNNPQELRKHLMDLLFELLTGKSGNVRLDSSYSEQSSISSENGFSMSSHSVNFSFGMSVSGGSTGVDGSAATGWNAESFLYESESVSYQAKGVINTSDGRTINVDINMHMSREFVSYMNFDVKTSRPIDPLVINYGGTAASLMGEHFMFDLTSDGNDERLAVLGEGSGFLAIDKNGDGKINDGSELFGPSSGCGFSELRKYDADGNGWIDEADDIFDKLVVWSRDKDGNDKSYSLKELGIGAIYLGDIATEFSFKDESNNTLGVMRSTSFFIKECGGAGTVSHIDMMV